MADKDFVLEFGSFQELLDGCASRLSEEGMYFDTAEVAAVGADITFEVRIRDGFSVLRGDGQIVRVTDDGSFVRLAYLDQPSLKLLPKLVDHYRRRGIPLLELPEVETIEPGDEEEGLEEELLGPVEEPTADDLFPEEETDSPSAPAGLTLHDLEAEFLADNETEEVEQESSADAGSGTLLLDATAAAIRDESENEAKGEADVEPALIDPEELIADSEEGKESLTPDEIHLDELHVAEGDRLEEAEEDSSITVSELDDQVEDVEVDSGLPWLPEESEKKSSKDLWVILLWIVLGAALGAAFYFFFLRPRDETSQIPAEPADIQARAVAAAQTPVEPMPITAEAVGPVSERETEKARRQEDFTEPASAAPRPRPPDPPTEPLTRVSRITWVDESDETVIIFWGDGLFVAEQVDDFRVVGGAPREVVRIRGIRRPFAQQQIDLDSDHVRRIRVGLHEEPDGLALHFVADLVDGDVELLRTEAAGEQLRVYFSKAG